MTSELGAAGRFPGGVAPLLVERGLAPPRSRLKAVAAPPEDGPRDELIAESAPMRRPRYALPTAWAASSMIDKR